MKFMMKRIVGIIMFIVPLFALCQENIIQDEMIIGAKWYYEETYFMNPDTGYAVFEVEKDTVIAGQVCYKIIGPDGFWYLPNNKNVAFTYTSNDTVFFYNSIENLFVPVFNNNAQAGDTIIVNWNNCTYEYSVNSVDSINMNGSYRKRYNIIELYYYISYTMVENIGCINKGFLPSESFFCDSLTVDGSMLGKLRCYIDSLIGEYHFTQESCDYSTIGIHDVDDASLRIKVWPSPVNNWINISGINGKTILYIYRNDGRLVMYDEVSNDSKYDVSSLKSGIYLIICVFNKEKQVNKIFKL